jgi:hypothetical protein
VIQGQCEDDDVDVDVVDDYGVVVDVGNEMVMIMMRMMMG